MLQADSANSELTIAPQAHPALAAAVAFAVGIAIDRAFPVPIDLAALAATVCAASWFVAGRANWKRAAIACLLGGVACLGAVRHHEYWSLRSPDHIMRVLHGERPLVRVVGTVAESPVIRSAQRDERHSAWPQADTTLFVLDCRTLIEPGGEIAVTGRVQVRVAGHLLHTDVGDVVEITGWMSSPFLPSNPGGYDFRDHLRRQHIDAVLHVSEPDAVTVTHQNAKYPVQRWIAGARNAADAALAKHLDPENRAVAAALLIGRRGDLPEDERLAFAKSGMMHVLAISGLHVGIFAGFVLLLCRLLNLAPWTTTLAILLAVLALAVISGGRPPVVRAAVLLSVAALGRPWNRQAALPNSLAISAIIVLAANPSHLFDTGAQLSFLAVLGIIWSRSWNPFAWERQATLAADEHMAPSALSLLRPVAAFTLAGMRILVGIWLFTAPLAAATFHLLSPIGLLLNLVLLPVIVLILWLGYGTLFSALLLPAVTPVFAVAFDWLLARFLGIVNAAAAWPFVHVDVPYIAAWWVAGYYAAVVGMLWFRSRAWGTPAMRGAAVAGWCAAGLLFATIPIKRDGLRCTFLSVGHGVAVLLELPGGETLLYDAGAIDDARRPLRAVRGALLHRGRAGLNALFVSHADLDHMNAAPRLLEELPVGGVFVAQSFLDFEQEGVRRVCDAAADQGVPIRIVGRGDRLSIDAEVELEVLHPALSTVGITDNANSLVLRIRYAGVSILLTGDLETEGMDELMQAAAGGDDVILAPHHGSLRANQADFAVWAKPAFVVVSSADDDKTESLRSIYGREASLYSTARHGAVTIEISTDGRSR